MIARGAVFDGQPSGGAYVGGMERRRFLTKQFWADHLFTELATKGAVLGFGGIVLIAGFIWAGLWNLIAAAPVIPQLMIVASVTVLFYGVGAEVWDVARRAMPVRYRKEIPVLHYFSAVWAKIAIINMCSVLFSPLFMLYGLVRISFVP